MTDCQNWDIRHLRDEHYNQVSEIAHWGDQTYLDYYYSHLGQRWNYYDITREKCSRWDSDVLLDQICFGSENNSVC